MAQLDQWTPEMDAIVATGINNGLSSQLIADELGVTRNAVLGRRFRLGLCNGKKPRQPKFHAAWRLSKPRKPKPDNIFALGRAARACGFTVNDLEEIRKDIEESKL
jgi:hypothetical protein